jgi:hypothetical protein
MTKYGILKVILRKSVHRNPHLQGRSRKENLSHEIIIHNCTANTSHEKFKNISVLCRSRDSGLDHQNS